MPLHAARPLTHTLPPLPTQAAPTKAIFVPTEAAWTAFNWATILGTVGDITPAQREAILKSLAAYHISREGLDLKALAASAAAGSKGRVLSVLGGANEAPQWSCPQMVGGGAAACATPPLPMGACALRESEVLACCGSCYQEQLRQCGHISSPAAPAPAPDP